jgi:hypothetical protein
MRIIPLTRGQIAELDNWNHKRIKRHKWCANRSRRNGMWYAVRRPWDPIARRYNTVYMHREILRLKKGERGPDHIDGNGLNNRESNLRSATHTQNMCNRGKQRNNTSGFKGVYFHKRARRWAAQIKLNQRWIYLGLFDEPEEAAHVYDAAALKYFGEFARPNFIN